MLIPAACSLAVLALVNTARGHAPPHGHACESQRVLPRTKRSVLEVPFDFKVMLTFARPLCLSTWGNLYHLMFLPMPTYSRALWVVKRLVRCSWLNSYTILGTIWLSWYSIGYQPYTRLVVFWIFVSVHERQPAIGAYRGGNQYIGLYYARHTRAHSSNGWYKQYNGSYAPYDWWTETSGCPSRQCYTNVDYATSG